MQTAIHATRALTAEGWRADVRLVLAEGAIAEMQAGSAARPGDLRCDIVLPAAANLHSHAFQRGMAGLAETRGPSTDDFWTWREVMYRFALSMTPDQMEAVAAQAYVEMLESGFARVGEFHYLHHDIDGRPYADVAEMAARIAGAAEAAGIGLTLLPVFYAHPGFGGTPRTAGQRRFVCGLDGYARLLDGCRAVVRGLDRAVAGVAPHSLRAVTPGELAAVVALAGGGPVHIHAAEQMREVEECLAWSGARPVEWLLDHAGVDGRWCLVHATHMTAAEAAGLARSGAVAGLCPITEANLGDGIFDGPRFAEYGGRFGIGSDSNVQIGLAEELRQLEYAQRLGARRRNVMAVAGGSTGRALLDGAVRGGAAALGMGASGLAAGAPADLVTMRADHPLLVGLDGDRLIDAWVFRGGASPVDGVWAGGRRVVEGGRHHARDAIEARFVAAMAALRGA